jgi:class 3 adenylate cyclase/tetratricopeptide (TPR) repeat protein
MNCPQCNFENPEGMHFCGKCGCALSILNEQPTVAPSLAEKLERIQRYLPQALAKRILSQKDRIEGERRQVTIMFCDMMGFTPLTERLGPEETFTLMDKVIEILIHKVNEYEGMVNEIRGDGILAVFGALDALEDAPQRAVRSAIEIHKKIEEFSRNLAGNTRIGPILLRIGINTGPVVIGTVGNDLRVQFTVVGDTINMASRMETLAEPGTTYVTEDTYRLTKELFHFQPLGKKPIKGKQQPISVYKVLSSKEAVHRPRLGSERTIYTSLVDRDVELNLLELQVMKVINGKGSVVNIIGEAGIGKSRLLAELKRRDLMEKVRLLEGRAISIGKNLSFHPIIDLLKRWTSLTADEGNSLQSLQASVRRILPEDQLEVLPFIATLMGIKMPPSFSEKLIGIEGEALEKMIMRSVRALLTKAAEISPLVLVFEDLHWADKSSIGLIEAAFRLTENHRILFINVFRPGYEETGGRITQTLKHRPQIYSLELYLKPLDESDTESLITHIVHLTDVHRPLIRKIVERTGGNPFFVEEVVRSFIDEGGLIMRDGAFHVTEKLALLPIPSKIQDVLTARMDLLEEQCKDILKVASVIGRAFLHRILLHVAPSIANMDAALSYLQEIQLLRQGSKGGEVEYLFNHALVHETAYESILAQRRKELHLRVADAIKSLFADNLHEFYGMLAYHYSKAESDESALEYLMKAGEEALKSSASNEALHYYQEALSNYLKTHGDRALPEDVATIEQNIGLALYNKGDYVNADSYFGRVLKYYWPQLPKNPVSKVFQTISGFMALLLSLYCPSLRFKEKPLDTDKLAIDLFFKKLKALAITDPKRFFLESFHFYKNLTRFDLALLEMGIGMFVGASTFFSFTGISFGLSRKILDLLKERVQKDDLKSYTVFEFSHCLHNFLEGNWDKISAYDDDLVTKNLNMGETYWASQHCYWHGCSVLYQGRFDVSEDVVRRLNGIIESYENELSILLKYMLTLELLLESRKVPEALKEIDEALVSVKKTNQGHHLIHMYSTKARILLLLGNHEEAKTWLEQARLIAEEVHTVPWQLIDYYRSRFEYDCVFRGNPSTDSGLMRPPIPIQSVH